MGMADTSQIKSWLTSIAVIDWVENILGKHGTNKLLPELIKQICSDTQNDCRVYTSDRPNMVLGINTLTWTLWAGFKKPGKIYTPDCPITLEKFILGHQSDVVKRKNKGFGQV